MLLVLDVCVPYPVSRHVAPEAAPSGGIGNIVVNPDNVQVRAVL